MGMYCACGVKKWNKWVCECDWKEWFLCWEQTDQSLHSIPIIVPVKKIPDKEGVYEVRVFEDGDYYETKSEFSLIEKNWGESTNKAISHWKIEYDDHWIGFRGVYAWKNIKTTDASYKNLNSDSLG
jgi:hypothetical protein